MPTAPSDPRTFYDELSDDYHLIYPDWAASVARQGAALDRVILDALGPGAKSVLDCSCGIGTQALGLAARGHRVTGADLSPRAAERAASEAAARNDALPVLAADMRHLPFAPGSFDVVLSADNSVAHLLTDADLAAALASMKHILRPGGLLVITMRDYTEALATRQRATQPQTIETQEGRGAMFQLWRWHDESDCYDLDHVQLLPQADAWQLRTRRATSRALTRTHVAHLAAKAGFAHPTWHDPASTAFFQPLLTASAPPHVA
jgi:SAM-dependent methyltransferase